MEDGTFFSTCGEVRTAKTESSAFPGLVPGPADAALSPAFTSTRPRNKSGGNGVGWRKRSVPGKAERARKSAASPPSPPPGRRCREAADEGRAAAPQRVSEWPLPRPPLTFDSSPRPGRGGAYREHRTLLSPDLFRGPPDAVMSPAFTSAGPRHKAGESGVGWGNGVGRGKDVSTSINIIFPGSAQRYPGPTDWKDRVRPSLSGSRICSPPARAFVREKWSELGKTEQTG